MFKVRNVYNILSHLLNVFYRRPTALDELAVRPITQFPITLDDEVSNYNYNMYIIPFPTAIKTECCFWQTPEEKYANYKGLRIVTMKKVITSVFMLPINT